MENAQSHIIVALDNLGVFKSVTKWAEQLAPYVAGFKLNDALDIGGITLCQYMKEYGEVMADPKLHDIPNTMRNRTQLYNMAGCTYVTVHAGNSLEALRAARKAAPNSMLLGVTILTSIEESECAKLYYDHGIRGEWTGKTDFTYVEQKVLEFAMRAQEADLDGIVCSPKELELLSRKGLLEKLKAVVPGVRSKDAEQHDQKRTMTPAEAIRLGAHRVVVGKEILESKDPVAQAKRINNDIVALR
jgi:orotidine-5'-phosphate decarboxylase